MQGTFTSDACSRQRSKSFEPCSHLLEGLGMFTNDLIDCLIRFAICSCQLQVGCAFALDCPRDACGRVLGQLLSGACRDT